MQIQKPRQGYKLVKWYYGKVKEIPENWNVLGMGEVTSHLENGLSYQHDKNEKIGIPITRIETISKETIDESRVGYVLNPSQDDVKKHSLNIDDILFSHINSFEHVGKTAIYNGTPKLLLHGMNLIRISANKKKISPKFLYYSLKFYPMRERFRAICNPAINQVSINTTQLKKFQIIIPSQIEQQKIASILSNIDALIQQTQKKMEQTQRLKKGLMQELLAKGIGHTKFKKIKWYFGKELEIPEEWEILPMERVLTLVQYGLSEELSLQGKYPIFRMNSIVNGFVVDRDMKFIDLDDKTFQDYKLEKGDLLFNRTNSLYLVGKIGIFLLEGNYTFASYLIRLRTNEKMNAYFLNLYLNTSSSQGRIKSIATPAVAQTNVNASNLKKILVPVPPVPEQQKISSILSTIASKIAYFESKKSKLEILKKGLMQKLLTGQIRVKV